MTKPMKNIPGIEKLPRSLRRRIAKADDTTSLLTDKKYDAFLYDKYKRYTDPGLSPVRDSVIGAWTFLNAALNSQEVVQGSGLYNSAGLVYARGTPDSRSPVYRHVFNNMANTNHYLAVYQNSVEIKLSLPPLLFSMGYGMGLGREANELHEKSRSKAEKIIQTILPDFKLPTMWKRNDGKMTQYGIPYAEAALPDLKSTKRMPLEFLAKLDVPFTPQPTYGGPKQYELAPLFKDNFDGEVTLEFSMPSGSTVVEGSAVSLAKGAGPLANLGVMVKYQIEVTAYVRFPMEYALWCTSCVKREQFIPKLFHDFAQRLLAHALRTTGGRKPNPRVSSLGSVRDANRDRQRRQNFLPRPRTNREGYTILDNGEVVWVPTVDNVADYMQAMVNAYDPVSNQVKTTTEINKEVAKGLRNRPIYTDWLNNRFAYTNEAGELKIWSLEGSVPLDNVTIHRLLDMSIVQSSEHLIFHPHKFFSILNTQVNLNPSLIPEDVRNRGPQYQSIETMVNYLANSGIHISFYELAGVPLEPGQERYQQVVTALSNIIKTMRSGLGDVANPNPKAAPKISYTQLAQYFRLGLDLVSTYGKQYEKYRDAFRRGINQNKTDQFSLDDIDKAGEEGKFDLPNLPGLTRYAPHQAQVVGALGKTPRFAILNVAPGGGKAPITISDIMMLKAAEKVGRPIVFMPKALIKQYVDEVHKFSKGKVNAFPVTLETVRRLRDVFGLSSDQIVMYIRSLPPNTIFVSDYNFLRNRTDLDTGLPVKDMVYGNEEITPYPMVDLLRRIEFDYLMADESQAIKNKDAQRTKALNTLAVDIPFRRIASGTIVSNTPTDIVGQVGMLNPSIFMSADKFALDYGKTFESGRRRTSSKAPKVLSWNGEIMGPAIKREILPYAQYHTKTRRDWSFLLPDVEENFFESPDLTDRQRKYYDDLMSEAYEQIAKDADLMKRMKEGAPEDEDAIEAKLARYFAKVEIFVNAPYEDKHYRDLVDVDDTRNQMSPKIGLIDQLIDSHFNGGSVAGVSFDKDLNKIVIFGYNVAVSKHIYKYSRHRNIMVHYEAGNDDALAKFLDPNSRYKILVANEDSIKEGFNFQIASHLIRVQTIWSPGPLEQAWSRILRPDFDRKYDRPEIRLSWVICPNTIEVPKTARLISKIIDKAKIDYDKQLPVSVRDADLEVLKMSLDVIKDYRTFDDIATAKGSNYLQVYAFYKNWQRKELHDNIKLLISREQKKTGKKDITRDDLMDLVMVPVTSTKDLPGSKRVYVPRVPGSQHFITTTGVSVVPASVVEEDDEGNVIEERVVRPLEQGMLVDTEFGPGHVTKVLDSSAWVQVKALPRPVKLPKAIIGVPATRKAEKKMRRLVANDLGTSLVPRGLPAVRDLPVAPEVEPDVQETNLPTLPEDQPEAIVIQASIINGIPTLWTATNDRDVAVLTRKLNWHVVPPFMAAQVKRYTGIQQFIDYIEKSGLSLASGNKALLLSLADVMKENKSRLLNVQRAGVTNKWRDYFSSSHRRPTDKNQVRVYPFIWEGNVFLALTPGVHSSKVVSKLRTMTPGNGMQRFETFEHQTIMFPYVDMRRALREIRDIERQVRVSNRDELVEQLKSIHLV